MQVNLFKQIYDSESVADIYRDVFECFDKRFNPLAKKLGNIFNINVLFLYKNKENKQIMLNKYYDNDSMLDVEEDITNSFKNISVIQDDNGFFEGDLILKITILN